MRRLSSREIVGISVLIGLASNFIPPVNPGMLFVGVAVAGLGNSKYEVVYVFLAIGFSSCLIAWFSHWILSIIFPDTEDPVLPLKGIIYTESEIEEFKRRGLM